MKKAAFHIMTLDVNPRLLPQPCGHHSARFHLVMFEGFYCLIRDYGPLCLQNIIS